MWWRLPRSQWEKQKGSGNSAAFRRRVGTAKVPPGILAYDNRKPVGWCAVAPREQYTALERSRILKPLDDEPVWSVTCFFIARGWRRKGLSVKLLRAAQSFARRHGASLVEGYPVEPWSLRAPDTFLWTGTPAAFESAGFREVLRRSRTRPIMRRAIGPAPEPE